MDLGNQRASGNVQDRRGMGMVGGGLGVGGVLVAIVAYFLGFDPGTALNVAQQVTAPHETREGAKGAPADEQGQFAAKVLGSTEDVWGPVFQQSNAAYRAPTMVLYERQTGSACGTGQSAMGPFYCPTDSTIYLDTAFFDELQGKFGAAGDFAQAYVIGHEVGHHIQNLTGVLGQEAAEPAADEVRLARTGRDDADHRLAGEREVDARRDHRRRFIEGDDAGRPPLVVPAHERRRRPDWREHAHDRRGVVARQARR